MTTEEKVTHSKKRKRDVEEGDKKGKDVTPVEKSKKRQKKEGETESPAVKKVKKEKASKDGKKKKGKGDKDKKDPRSLAERTLFVGQVPFDATADEIKSIFEAKEGITSVVVRPLTDKKTKSFRGTAFVEFKTISEATLGLSLHHQTVRGRRINVERTLKGSGSANRKEQLLNLNNNSLKLSEKKVNKVAIKIYTDVYFVEILSR